MMSAKWYFLWCHYFIKLYRRVLLIQETEDIEGKIFVVVVFSVWLDRMKKFLLFWTFFFRYSANTLSSVELELQMQSSMRERNLKLGETRWEGLHMVLMLVNLLTCMGKEAIWVSS